MLTGERDGCVAIFNFPHKDDGGVSAMDEANQSTNKSRGRTFEYGPSFRLPSRRTLQRRKCG
jgi:hypothetical protein